MFTKITTNKAKQIGFSLIELLVSLVLLAILASLSQMSFQTIIARTALKFSVEKLLKTISLARLHALLSHNQIVICTTNFTKIITQCDNKQNWHSGWIAFVDSNQNQQYDSNEQLLQQIDITNAKVLITSKQTIHQLIFNAGSSSFTATTLSICAKTTKHLHSYKLFLSSSGVARLETKNTIKC